MTSTMQISGLRRWNYSRSDRFGPIEKQFNRAKKNARATI